MPTKTGIFTQEECEGHLFSYRLAQFISKHISNKDFLYDFGCGPGAYLRYLIDSGFKEYLLLGIEGTETIQLEVDRNLISFKDLTEELNFKVTGNAICLEVAEHIPEQYEDVFLKNITSVIGKSKYLIMSWAVLGQAGTGHVNCRPNKYAIDKISSFGFIYREDLSIEARKVIEGPFAYFRETILIFEKI